MLPKHIHHHHCALPLPPNLSPTAAGRPYPTLAHGTVPLFAPWFQLLLTAEGQIPERCGRQCGELGLRAVASVIDG